ncbi:MAG: acyl-CoA synthetase [bacterium]|nr:acyl-CoA synthetase [bacterium]
MHPGKHAQKFPDATAHVFGRSGEVVTWGELDERSNRLTQLMWDAGLRRGDHVAIFMENHPRYFEVYWAAIRSGLYFTTVNRYLSAEEAAFIIDDCGAQVLITSATLGDVAAAALPRIPRCPIRLMVDGTREGFDAYEDAIAGFPNRPLDKPWRGELMLYSSGTTGNPKGIMRPLTDTTVDDENTFPRMIGGLFSLDGESIYLSPAPLYHSAPMGFTTTLQSLGGTVVVMEKFEPLEALRCIEAYGVTHSQWVPTMFTRMLKTPEADRAHYDLSSHRIAVHAAAPCPPRVKREMIDWWGPILLEYYGGTELNGLTFINSEEWLAHEGSVGKAVMGSIRICDDDGKEVPTGEDGLVYFERPAVSFHYHNDEEKTRSSQHPAHENWSALGDVGHVDEDGYLYLTDRKTFMIISGGVNIYPAEIENTLVTHPKVIDVAVIGVPNEEFGEEVKAIVQLVEGEAASPELEQELMDFCRKHIAHYKCPRSVDFEEELPRLPTGKLYKRFLRDRYWGKTGSKIVS